MKLVKRLGLIATLALMTLGAREAAAMNWSVGANLGYSTVMPADKYDAENLNYIAWPNSDFSPGMRFGFTGENPAHEVFIDTGLRLFSTGDLSSRDLILSGNFQYNFGSSGSNHPFVTGGLGVYVSGLKNDDPLIAIDESATSVIYGLGVGMRHKMGHGNGTMRAELRFDRMAEGEDGTSIVIPEATIITFRLGFDLWGK